MKYKINIEARNTSRETKRCQKQIQAQMRQRLNDLSIISTDELTEAKHFWEAVRDGVDHTSATYKKAELAVKLLDNEVKRRKDHTMAQYINDQMKNLINLTKEELSELKSYWQANVENARDNDEFDDALFTLKRILKLEYFRINNLPIPSVIDDFFPIFGVTLNETTVDEFIELGGIEYFDDEIGWFYYYIENIELMSNGTSFYAINWKKGNRDFPDSWKSKGFSWDNSYDKWLDIFEHLGFVIRTESRPRQELVDGHIIFRENLYAVSIDGKLSFDFYFDYGEDGPQPSSPNTLYSMHVHKYE